MYIRGLAYYPPLCQKPHFYLFILQLDALKESVTNGNTTVFLDSDSPIAQIFEGIQ